MQEENWLDWYQTEFFGVSVVGKKQRLINWIFSFLPIAESVLHDSVYILSDRDDRLWLELLAESLIKSLAWLPLQKGK